MTHVRTTPHTNDFYAIIRISSVTVLHVETHFTVLISHFPTFLNGHRKRSTAAWIGPHLASTHNAHIPVFTIEMQREAIGNRVPSMQSNEYSIKKMVISSCFFGIVLFRYRNETTSNEATHFFIVAEPGVGNTFPTDKLWMKNGQRWKRMLAK